MPKNAKAKATPLATIGLVLPIFSAAAQVAPTAGTVVTGTDPATWPFRVIWFAAAGLGCSGFLLAVLSLRRRNRAAGAEFMVPASRLRIAEGRLDSHSVPSATLAQAGSLEPPTHSLAEPRLAMGVSVSGLEQAGLISQVSRWLKEKLVRGLVADRSALLENQRNAARRTEAVQESLTRIEWQIQHQTRAYDLRIEGLNRELLAAKEENRALIQAKISQVNAEMETARIRILAGVRHE